MKEVDEFTKAEQMFAFDDNADTAVIENDELNVSDVLSELDDIQIGEYPSAELDELTDIHDKNRIEAEDNIKRNEISEIMRFTEKNYQDYIKHTPNFNGLEDFLKSLPSEQVSDIRHYAQDNHIYGNMPLEQMLIMQYGVCMQVRDWNKMAKQWESMLEKSVSKATFNIDSKFNDNIKQLEGVSIKIAKKLVDLGNTIETDKKEKFSRSDEQFQKDKEELGLRLRNEILDPIKKDVSSMKDIVHKGAKEAVENYKKEVSADNTWKLIAFTMIGSIICSSVFIAMGKIFGLFN